AGHQRWGVRVRTRAPAPATATPGLGPESALAEIRQLEAVQHVGPVAGDHDDTAGPADPNVFAGQGGGAAPVHDVETHDAAKALIREWNGAIPRAQLEASRPGDDVWRAPARAPDRQDRRIAG